MKYGDKIKLHWSKGNEKFYVSTDGSSTGRVYFRRDRPTGKEKDAFQEKDIFIVVPSSECRIFERLKTDIKSCIKDSKQGKNKNLIVNNESKEDDLVNKDDAYQQDVPEEIMSNWLYHKSMFGKPVRYNSVIQLVHESTQQFVRISKKVNLSQAQEMEGKTTYGPSRTDFMRVYSLKLNTCSGPETEFIFTPCFKYQDNDDVLVQDSFCLTYKDRQLLDKKFYLHFQPLPGTENKTCLSFYLTEEEKSPIKFEFYESVNTKGHLFEKLHGQVLAITHIQIPIYLSLRRIEKTSDQEENVLSELIEQADEALSQALSLSFKEYDPNQFVPSDGISLIRSKDRR